LGLGLSQSSKFDCNTTAVYPEHLIDQIIDIYKFGEKKNKKQWTNILDPFAGTGTTGFSCIRNDINFFGIEFSPSCYNFMLNHFFSKQCVVFGNDKRFIIKKKSSPKKKR
jgi:DNA modification methylase